MRPGRIHDAFPAPSYRPNQREALDAIAEAFDTGAKVVLVRAPTGSGKSLLARAICGCARDVEEASPHQPTGAYYTTPQVSQLDAVGADPLLDDIAVIRGKRNYTCELPDERTTPVDRAPCARISGYDCSIQHRCPYFADRDVARQRRIAGMTLAYFMQTAGSGLFDTRDVVVIDEAHGLSEWAEMYATITLSPQTVPMWSDLTVPDVRDDLDRLATFSDALVERCRDARDNLSERDELTASEVAERDQLAERISELEWFVRDYGDPTSPTTWVIDQRNAGEPIAIKPLDPARFLHRTVWDRGEHFALLSATILSKDGFCHRTGLDPDDVQLVEVPHTFPLEHRPIYDVTQGEMTMQHRDETLPGVARTLLRVMATHPDEKGIVHCHSYAIQAELHQRLTDMGVANRLVKHDRDDRDDVLETWCGQSDPTVFLSVTMEEALDLSDDLARWQVLCKAPFPNVGDPTVAARLDAGDWAWYYRRTLRTIIQACGRVVRSPDDHGVTYLADSSILKVFERTRGVMPNWFREQVEGCTVPELAPFDPPRARGDVHQPTSSRSDAGPDHPLADVWKN